MASVTKVKGVMYTSDRVANKNRPKGRGSAFFIAAVLHDTDGLLGQENREYEMLYPLSRVEEAVKRAKSNPEDVFEVIFSESKWWKPWTWKK